MIALGPLSFMAAAFSISNSSSEWPNGMVSSRISAKSSYVHKLEEAIEAASKHRLANQGVFSAVGSGIGEKDVPTGLAPVSSDEPPAELVAKIRADLQPAFDAHFAGVNLMRVGKLAQARAELESSLVRYPTELIALPLLDVDLAEGDYVSAYKLAVPFVRSERPSAELLLRASMAAAGVGEVYPRQRAFLTDYLSRHYWDTRDIALLPTGESAQTVLAISALAISGEHFIHGEVAEAVPFVNVFLTSDPTNPIYCNTAGHEYSEAGQYSRAINAFQQGLARATENTRFQALAMMGLAKQRLKDYGDGNLPPSPWPQKADPKTIKP